MQTERQQHSPQRLDRRHVFGRELGPAVQLLRDLRLEVDVFGKRTVQIAFNDFGILVGGAAGFGLRDQFLEQAWVGFTLVLCATVMKPCLSR